LDSKNTGEKTKTPISNATSLRKLLNFIPGILLVIVYFSATILTSGETYNLFLAGALIGIAICIRWVSDKMFRGIVRYMFLSGAVIGVAGVSPPLYFAIAYGVWSPIEFVLGIVCIILTAVTIIKAKAFNLL
jgi:hypothetical protein